jgi:hypothetical protein
MFQEGLRLYYEGDWQEAKKVFKKTDLPTVQIFMERMQAFKNPPLGWSGIWTMTTK